MFKGITKRWVLNTLCTIVAIVVFAVVCLSYFFTTYYYSSVEQTLSGRSVELMNILSDYNSDTDAGFSTTVRDYVENFSEKESMEITVIGRSGNIMATSTGFTPEGNEPMPDFDAAKEASSGYAKWTGRLSTGEKVCAVTRIVRNTSGNTV